MVSRQTSTLSCLKRPAIALVYAQNICLSYNSKFILDNISIQIQEGEKVCLLGRNGCGKSSLLKLIAGQIRPDSGQIQIAKAKKVGFLQQEIANRHQPTVYDIVRSGIGSEEYLHQMLDNKQEAQSRRDIEKILSFLNLSGEADYSTLSVGMQRRVLLGKALVLDPDLLLLDEPTNHLDIAAIEWLEDFLKNFSKTILFVTHDRNFMESISQRILEIENGHLFDWDCNYNQFLIRKEAWWQAQEAQNRLFDKKLAQEETWIRKGIRARRTRNEGRVRELIKMRQKKQQRQQRVGQASIEILQGETSGKLIIEAEDISYAYGDSKIIDQFNALIHKGDKIGIVGENGCGKSTLIKILLGQLKPQSGLIRLGKGLTVSYFDQLREKLDLEKTVKENVAEGNDLFDFNGKKKHVYGYLQDFLFSKEQALTKAKLLSGGEKNRLLLAKFFSRPTNFIIMDEPTNDLDIETIELLEELLTDFSGTLLIVSHDRLLLHNIVDSVIIFTGHGQVNHYLGGYRDWRQMQKAKPIENNSKQNETKQKSLKKQTSEKNIPVIKLSFKEKRELESLPDLLAQKEKARDSAYAKLSDPNVYRNQGSAINQLQNDLQILSDEIETMYQRWQELEAKKPPE